MPSLYEPSWTRVYCDLGLGAASLLALGLLRYKIYLDRRNALFNPGRFYDPNQFLDEFMEEGAVADDEESPHAEAMQKAEPGAWRKPAGVLLHTVLIVAAGLCFFFGYQSYRAVSDFEDANRYYLTHDFARAISAYHDALDYDVNSPAIHYRLGFALAAVGDLGKAIAEYRRAIRLDPKHISAHIDLGNALQSEGQVDEAILMYQRAIALSPKSEIAYLDLGNAFVRRRRLDDAIQAYRHAIRLSPTNALGHVNLGNALLAAGRLDEAVMECRQATLLAPNSIVTHNNLGNALLAQGKLDEAIAEFRKTTELIPEYAYGYFNLGNALMKSGQRQPAIAAFDTYLNIAENRPEYGEGIRKAQEYLNQLGSGP
jgi:tetratricopeptide (TPR) repeat protein